MCQTAVIQSNILKIGRTSYLRRFQAVEGNGFTARKLASLNRSLDNFYELLYGESASINETAYSHIGPYMQIMLETVKDLYVTCESHVLTGSIANEIERLKRNYAALHELDSDIREFKIGLAKDNEMASLLAQASEAIATLNR